MRHERLRIWPERTLKFHHERRGWTRTAGDTHIARANTRQSSQARLDRGRRVIPLDGRRGLPAEGQRERAACRAAGNRNLLDFVQAAAHDHRCRRVKIPMRGIGDRERDQVRCVGDLKRRWHRWQRCHKHLRRIASYSHDAASLSTLLGKRYGSVHQ